jgi:hypothetical protein
MLHALPFTTFGEAAAFGLEADVYCPELLQDMPVGFCGPSAARSMLRPHALPVHQCQVDGQHMRRPGLSDIPADRAAACWR